MRASAARRECRRMIVAMVGPGGLEAFLQSPQPALDDRTGSELMESDPAALLERLKALECQVEGGTRDG